MFAVLMLSKNATVKSLRSSLLLARNNTPSPYPGFQAHFSFTRFERTQFAALVYILFGDI